MRRAVRYASWAARIALAALFLAAATMKLAGQPEAIATFERLGAGQWLRYAIGVLELAGALGLLLTPLAGLAALGLAALMVGAILSHLLVLGPSPVPAIVALALALFVVWAELPTLRFMLRLPSGKGPMDGWVAQAYDRGIQTAFRDLFPVLSRDLLPRVAGARRILDVGCGPGQFTIMIAEALPDAEIVGVDLAPAMIELARAHAAGSPAAARLRFEVGDAAALPFPDASFDAVISSGSIKQWPDPGAGIHEMHRVLMPGGRALVGEMNRDASEPALRAMVDRAQHWVFHFIMPRILRQSLAPAQAEELFAASPFGGVRERMLLLDGFFWMVEAQKPLAGASVAGR